MRQGSLSGVEREKIHDLELFGGGDMQNIKAAAADHRAVERSPLRCGAKNGHPVDRLRKQTAGSQIAFDVGPGGADLGWSEDCRKTPNASAFLISNPCKPVNGNGPVVA